MENLNITIFNILVLRIENEALSYFSQDNSNPSRIP